MIRKEAGRLSEMPTKANFAPRGLKSRSKSAGFWTDVAMIGAISLLFGAVQINQSLNQGQLAFPVTYDTNGYFTRSLNYLKSLQQDGVWGLLTELADDPPRSASTTLISLIGFALIGVKDWAPNVIQIFEVGLLLLVVMTLAAQSAPAARYSLLVYALCWPISGFLIVENRPDILWGLTSAAAVHLLLSSNGVAAHRRTLLCAGMLAGVALLCKTTILPLTFILLASAFAAWLALRVVHLRQTFWRSLREGRVFLLATLLIPAPFLAFALLDTVRYVAQVIFSKRADQFLLGPPGSFWDEMAFYLNGPGGRMTIGSWLWVTMAIVAVSLVIVVLRKSWDVLIRGVAIAAIILVAYLSIAIPQLKSPFFGAMFAFLLMFASIRCAIVICNEVSASYIQLIAAACIVTISVLLFHFPSFYRPFGVGRDILKQASYWNRTMDDIVETVAKLSEQPARVYLTTLYEFANPDSLQWINDKLALPRNKFIAVLHPEHVSDYDQALDGATAAVVFDSSVVSLHPLTSREQHEKQSAEIRSDPGFEFIRNFSLPDGRAFARLYQRFSEFSGIDPASLGSREVLREVETFGEDGYSRRRTFATATRVASAWPVRISLFAARSGQYVVEASMAAGRQQALKIEMAVDSKELAVVDVGSVWKSVQLPMHLDAGTHNFDMQIKGIDGVDAAGGRNGQVSFRRFQLLPLPASPK